MNPELETVVTYTVYEYTHDGLVLTNQFFSMDDVNRFVDDYSSRSSTVYVFRTSCCDVFRPLNTSTNGLDTLAQVASTMTVPPFEFATPDEEEAANRHQSVSFQNEAIVISTIPEDEEVSPLGAFETVEPELPYQGFPIRKYGKGYVLIPPKGHELYGKKYINENRGLWNRNADGWFFRKQFLSKFKALGGVMEI